MYFFAAFQFVHLPSFHQLSAPLLPCTPVPLSQFHSAYLTLQFLLLLYFQQQYSFFPEILTVEMQSPATFFQVPYHLQVFRRIHYNSMS